MINTKLDVPPQPDAAEIEWNKALKNLDNKMAAYRRVQAAGNGNVKEMDRAAEDIASAMDHMANQHPDPRVKAEYRTKAKELRASTGGQRDTILEDIGKGLLILLTTPFALVGAILGTVGQILNGVGSILRGLGKLANKPRELVG
ncbi:uncharacterized protein LACBIDRAFT_294456 [Laccaria bicolor S238N-H82]|uniref:Predicted protein n=1 Tax=Laccaria bicolor (strain S238N-H82 / ATCC MYA-4686) TaxID=486041 RepID=B0DBZ5_LACBS|nr:uncharacterized protein LACBIDRAFT_294456 [Laccaria bicolor S238N-H82]EDR07805.1 predicted protein [Laccaria bicolor S238N-H82]|eukprot:XP_001881594.1 predicted protein [Laccaria bicolor S238N-H82]